jgi:hypothetical protein
MTIRTDLEMYTLNGEYIFATHRKFFIGWVNIYASGVLAGYLIEDMTTNKNITGIVRGNIKNNEKLFNMYFINLPFNSEHNRNTNQNIVIQTYENILERRSMNIEGVYSGYRKEVLCKTPNANYDDKLEAIITPFSDIESSIILEIYKYKGELKK